MADDRLRALERRFAREGGRVSQEALARERIRIGELTATLLVERREANKWHVWDREREKFEIDVTPIVSGQRPAHNKWKVKDYQVADRKLYLLTRNDYGRQELVSIDSAGEVTRREISKLARRLLNISDDLYVSRSRTHEELVQQLPGTATETVYRLHGPTNEPTRVISSLPAYRSNDLILAEAGGVLCMQSLGAEIHRGGLAFRKRLGSGRVSRAEEAKRLHVEGENAWYEANLFVKGSKQRSPHFRQYGQDERAQPIRQVANHRVPINSRLAHGKLYVENECDIASSYGKRWGSQRMLRTLHEVPVALVQGLERAVERCKNG